MVERRWIARVVREDPSDPTFTAYVEETPGEALIYKKDRNSVWRNDMNSDEPRGQLKETLDYLCSQAEERQVAELAGTYGEEGPETVDYPG